MPRYFFHIREGDKLVRDLEGCVLPDLEAARREALAEARDLLAAYVRAGTLLDGQQFDIADGNGQVLMEVRLREALNLPH